MSGLALLTPAAHAQAADASCAAAAALLGDGWGPVLLVRDTLVRDPRHGNQARGCAVRLAATAPAPDAPAPDERLRRGLAALGWEEDLAYAADGPDGTAFAMHGTQARCFVSAVWNRDGDLPYRLDVGCVPIR